MPRNPASGKLALPACFFLLVAACFPILVAATSTKLAAASTNDNFVDNFTIAVTTEPVATEVAVVPLAELPMGNDIVSSIRVASGWEAVLYEHINYRGKSETFTCDDPNLCDNPIGNDTVSSIRVYRRSENAAASGVVLYEDINYGGRSKTFTADEADFRELDNQTLFTRYGWGTAPQTRELPPGEYHVFFGDVSGYVAPSERVVNIENENLTVVGSYRLLNFWELPRIEDNSATVDNTTVHVSIPWDEQPTSALDSLPRHNSDNTFYTGDAFALRIVTAHTLNDEAYAVEVRSPGMGVNDRFEVGNSHNDIHPYEIPDSTTPNLYKVEVSMVPRKAILRGFPRFPGEQWAEGGGKTILKDEWETRTIDSAEFASDFRWELDPGHYTIVFDPENEEAAPKVTETITLMAGKDYCLRGIKEWYDTGGCAGDPSYNPSYLPPPALYTGVNVCVVQCAPRFATASYLWSTYDAGGEPASSYETPLVTIVRYDGNNYDPDNEEHLSLKQRAVVNTIRWSGYAEKLKTAEVRKPQTTDDYSENEAQVMMKTIAMIEYRDEAGQLWHTFESIDGAMISVRRASDNALVASGRSLLEFSCPPGVYNIHTEDWYGSVNFEIPHPNIFYSERWWYAPLDISVALPSGDPGEMLILLEPAPELQFQGGEQSPYTPVYRVPSGLQTGTPSNPPRHPYYRYYDNGELAYYEPSDVEVWDNGTPKQVVCDVADSFFNTRIYTNINPPFNNLEIYDNNTLAFEGSSWYQLTYAENPWFIETAAGRTVEKVMGKDEGGLCTVTSYLDAGSAGDWESGKISGGISAVFDESRRYGRFVVVPDRRSMKELLDENYEFVGFDTQFLWYPADKGWTGTKSPYSSEDEGYEKPPGYDQMREMFPVNFAYTPIGNFQPVRAAAWKLTDNARASVYENDNYEALFDDNSWAVDRNVEFKAEFIPMVVIKETLENMRENEAYRERVRQEYPELASLDEAFIDQIIEDTGADQEPVQELGGAGESGFTLERHNCELFYLTARAWRPGENSVENVGDLINVPFDPNENLWIHINLSGDGMYARVGEQTGEYFKISVFSPQRAGEISSITVRDNEGRTVYLWRSYPQLAMTTFVLGASGDETFATPPEEIELAKVPGMSTRFYVELTNAWGASRTVAISVSPYKSEFEVAFDTLLLVLFGVLVGAIFFSAGARWLRMRHRTWAPYG